jgi:hypothetical protein
MATHRRGGYRGPTAKRPLKFGEPTRVVRLPVSRVDEILAYLRGEVGGTAELQKLKIAYDAAIEREGVLKAEAVAYEKRIKSLTRQVGENVKDIAKLTATLMEDVAKRPDSEARRLLLQKFHPDKTGERTFTGHEVTVEIQRAFSES